MIKKKKIIYITDHLFSIDNFYNFKKNRKKYNIILNEFNRPIKSGDLKKIFKKYKHIHGIIAGLERYNFHTFNGQNNLKVISRTGVGIDSLDLNYLQKKNIKVLRLKNELTDSVAELFVTLILISLRKIIPNFNFLKKGIWKPIIGNNIKNKKIGIIGFGKIGKKIYKLLKIFNCNFYFFEKKKLVNKNLKKISLEKIFQECDVACVSLNLNNETKNIINSKILNRGNKKIIIINASRGAIINENDLFNFLKRNKESSAFLDCFVEEPYNGKLLKLSNTFSIPHIASYTEETRREMEISASKNLIKYLDTID